jgi:DegV family protein with EDD domain
MSTGNFPAGRRVDVDKVAVVTDSVAMLPADLADQNEIEVVPILLNIGDRSYRDGLDITTAEFYRLLRTSERLPTTSAPSVGTFIEAFETALAGAEQVVAVHVSAQLTSVHRIATMAAQSIPGDRVHVIDSQSATMAQGFIALAAARRARQGGETSEVVRAAVDARSKTRFFAFLETMDYLRRSGRVPGAVALMGSAIQLKPIVHIVEGEVASLARPRTRRRATQTLIDLMAREVDDRPVRAAVLHADCLSDAEELRERIAVLFDCRELYVSEMTPVMGTHTGPGLLGLAYQLE